MNQGLTFQKIGMGALAGAATALLCLSLASGSILAIFLFFISPVPLMIAGLGFGLSAALTGAIVAVVGTFLFANWLVAVLVALAIAGPACTTGYWLNLARPAEEVGGPQDKLAWYPLADVLFANALFTGTAYVVLGGLIGFGPQLASAFAAELIERLKATNPDAVISAESAAGLSDFLLTVIPIAQPFLWMMALTMSIYLATAIARRSDLVKRPRENWPLALRMPRAAIFAFLAAVLASFVPGGIGQAGGSFVGALGAGFTMAGLAIVHARTRSMAGRFVILLLAYLSMLFVAFSVLIFLVAGLFGAGRHIPLSPASNSNPIQKKND